MQQLVVENSQWHFAKTVNELLMDGWRIVPGTAFSGTVEIVPRQRTHPGDILPNGRALRPMYMIALENEDVQ